MTDSSAHPASEVLEDHAEGDLKGIFGDIKKTFRVPFVPATFGLLATEADYLRVAWRQIHTNAQTVYFESRADDIRRLAVESMAELGEVRIPVVSYDIGDVLRTLHYVNPKLLLAVAALRAALSGQVPRAVVISSAEKRQLTAGAPDGMVAPTLIGTDTDDARIRTVFDAASEAAGSGMVPAEYRALAHWPDYLEGVWRVAQDRRTEPGYRRTVRELGRAADEAVLAFPFRMDVTPHTLRHAGLSEAQIDRVRFLLTALYQDLSHSVASVAGQFTAIEGREIAAQTPYPATTA